MTKEIEKWWNASSKWYQESANIDTTAAQYGPFCPDENELRLLGNVKGKKILEIGCGGGQCSIAFAKQGATCTGIDISQEQLNYAEALAKKNKVKITFMKGDIQNLKGIRSHSQDIVFSAYALQYVPHLTKCFTEVHRVLKNKGLFVFSVGTPFFDIVNRDTHKVVKSYHKLRKVKNVEIWPDGYKHIFVEYQRKISDIFNSLIDADFTVERILEPLKMTGQRAWARGEWKTYYPKKITELIGTTTIFTSRK